MEWQVFGGEAHELYLALLKERLRRRTGWNLRTRCCRAQFRLHLHRGIGYLATPHMIGSISDLVGLAMQVEPPEQRGAGNGLDRHVNGGRTTIMKAIHASTTISVEMEVSKYREFRGEDLVEVWGHVGDYEVCIFLSKADERVRKISKNHVRMVCGWGA